MSRHRTRAVTAGAAGLLAALLAAPAAAGTGPTAGSGSAAGATAPRATSKHVLLISVDGMHQSDLARYVRTRPTSALAALVRGGVQYTHARTPFPSDSFPGLVGQVTGGNPRSTGVYYDVSYNRRLLPAGTTSCAGVPHGAPVVFDESIDRDPSRLDAGQGLPGLPGGILRMTGNPRPLIDPAALPVDPKTCKPVYPHEYLRVNTVFNVARAHGLRTAWSDKHPAYEILDGPSGNGVQDLFTPEIDSLAPGYAEGDSWTDDNLATRQYDAYKVRAVLNEIDGLDHSGRHKVGTPAVFGMNFQSVSTAEKLASSDGATGGYLPGGTEPGPVLQGALDFVNSSVGALVGELYAHRQAADTTIILSAKHGQSPTDPADLTRIDDGAILDALNAAWRTSHGGTGDLVAAASNDDGMLLWLSVRTPAALSFAAHYLTGHSATGTTVSGSTRTLASSGLRAVHPGAAYFGVPRSEARHPDLVGIAQHGVVYTTSSGKIAEHGGNDPQDRHVPLLVSGPHIGNGAVRAGSVETTQIAPTILRLLGLDPRELQAVRLEHTGVLPGL